MHKHYKADKLNYFLRYPCFSSYILLLNYNEKLGGLASGVIDAATPNNILLDKWAS